MNFSLFVLHLNTHYVAIVPADLQSAGIEYKKFSAANFLIRLKYR